MRTGSLPSEMPECSGTERGSYLFGVSGRNLSGDRFYESCGSYVCEECLKGMTIDEIFELLGESLEEA